MQKLTGKTVGEDRRARQTGANEPIIDGRDLEPIKQLMSASDRCRVPGLKRELRIKNRVEHTLGAR